MKINDNVIVAALVAIFAVGAGAGCRGGATARAATAPSGPPKPGTPKGAGALGFYSPPGWAVPPISAGVTLPPGRRLYVTSGIPPAGAPRVTDQPGKNPLGDTRTQARVVLRAIQGLLEHEHLGMKDVFFLRVYIAPDRSSGAGPDYPGWFAAYGEFFDNAQNPVKVARSTIGVQSLINPDWLIEIEAVAAYPEPGEPRAGN